METTIRYGHCLLADRASGEYLENITLYLDGFPIQKDPDIDHHALVIEGDARWFNQAQEHHLPYYSVYGPEGSPHGDYIVLEGLRRTKVQSVETDQWLDLSGACAIYAHHTELRKFWYPGGHVEGSVSEPRTAALLDKLASWSEVQRSDDDHHLYGRWQIDAPICALDSEFMLIGDTFVFDDFYASGLYLAEMPPVRDYYLRTLDRQQVHWIQMEFKRAVNNHTIELRVQRMNEPETFRTRPLWVDFGAYQLPLYNLNGAYRIDDPALLGALMLFQRGSIGEVNVGLNPEAIGYEC